MDTPTLHEDAWRWRLDDGAEGSGGATWHELEDVAHEFDTDGLDVNVRLRFAVHVEVAQSDNRDWDLEYSLNGGTFTRVDGTTSTVARMSTSANFTTDDDTTEHGVTFSGSGSFHTDNDCMNDDDGRAGGAPNDVAAQDYEAVEFCFHIREADVSDTDEVRFRVTDRGTDLTSYPGTHATATISLPAGARRIMMVS